MTGVITVSPKRRSVCKNREKGSLGKWPADQRVKTNKNFKNSKNYFKGKQIINVTKPFHIILKRMCNTDY